MWHHVLLLSVSGLRRLWCQALLKLCCSLWCGGARLPFTQLDPQPPTIRVSAYGKLCSFGPNRSFSEHHTGIFDSKGGEKKKVQEAPEPKLVLRCSCSRRWTSHGDVLAGAFVEVFNPLTPEFELQCWYSFDYLNSSTVCAIPEIPGDFKAEKSKRNGICFWSFFLNRKTSFHLKWFI